MSNNKANTWTCQTCGEFHNRLYLNDGSGEWDCGTCLLQSDPYMTPQQTASVKRYLAREAQARKNFGGKEETAHAA